MLRFLKQALLLLVPAVILAAVSAAPARAENPVSAYIMIRCTATISVELFDRVAGGGFVAKTTYYNFGDVAAASTATVVNPIGVRNNSLGAITRWELDVLEFGGYVDPVTHLTLGATPGLNRAALYAKFSTNTLTASDYNVASDTIATTSQGVKTYNENAFYDYCTRYMEQSYSTDGSRVLPSSYDGTAEGKAERQLWLKILTPTAVESSNVTSNIFIRLTAK